MDNELNYHNIKQLNVDGIPEEYLPEKDVLHDDEESPHLELIKSYINKLELKAYKIREEEWKVKFSNIPNSIFKKMMTGCRKIENREQLIMI